MRCPTLAELPPPPPGKTGWPWNQESPAVPQFKGNGETWPRFTVVTPSFNQGEFIEETIRSVLLQGYPNLEYLIVDGGSSDNSAEVIRKYERWLAYWESQPDKGQCDAINKGFARSSGTIMAWLNSDDGFYPDALTTVAENISRPLQLLVGATMVGENFNSAQRVFKKPTRRHMMYLGSLLPQPSAFWTRALWELAGPLDLSLYYTMDYDLWLRMLERINEIDFVDQVFSLARLQPNQKIRPETVALMNLERERVALQAARRAGDSPRRWLLKVFYHQARRAVHNCNPRVWEMFPAKRHYAALRTLQHSKTGSESLANPH